MLCKTFNLKSKINLIVFEKEIMKKREKRNSNKIIKDSFSSYLDNIYNFVVVILIVSPILAYSISVIIINLFKNYPQNQQFIVGAEDGWLSFMGSIISGAMTLFAVIFTIKF